MRANGVSRHARHELDLPGHQPQQALAGDRPQAARGRGGGHAPAAHAWTCWCTTCASRAIERLGLGHAACAAINPRLVYCVATGFGEDGPDAGKPAFDDVIQAACGLAGLLGHETGQPDYVPSLIADKTTGLALANAVLAALFERNRSGQGQYVEVPMFETMVAFTLAEHLGGLSFEPADRSRRLCAPAGRRSQARAHARRARGDAAVHRRALAQVLRAHGPRRSEHPPRGRRPPRPQCPRQGTLRRHGRAHAHADDRRPAGAVRRARHPGHAHPHD